MKALSEMKSNAENGRQEGMTMMTTYSTYLFLIMCSADQKGKFFERRPFE